MKSRSNIEVLKLEKLKLYEERDHLRVQLQAALLELKYYREWDAGPNRCDNPAHALLEQRLAALESVLRRILAADERGQGLPFKEAMDEAQRLVEKKELP